MSRAPDDRAASGGQESDAGPAVAPVRLRVGCLVAVCGSAYRRSRAGSVGRRASFARPYPPSRRARAFTSSQRRRDGLLTRHGAHRGAVVRVLPPLYVHRLGRAYGPDSSAAALCGALAAGVDGLESDVCLTADGALVLLHDPYLPLGTDLEGFAHERIARELRARGCGTATAASRRRPRCSWRTCSRPRRATSSSSSRSRRTQTPRSPGAPWTRWRSACAAGREGSGSRCCRSGGGGGGVRASGGARLHRAACRVGRLRPGGAGALGPPAGSAGCAWSTSCSRRRSWTRCAAAG